MKLYCSLEYGTSWGEDVRVELTLKRRNGRDKHILSPLFTNDGMHWHGEVQISDKEATSFVYRYCICRDDEIVRREWNVVQRIFPYNDKKTFTLADYWKDLPVLNHLYTSAYTACVQVPCEQEPQIPYFDKTLLFRVQAPQLQTGQCLALVGELPQLGSWVPERALPMSRGGIHEWCLTLSATGLKFPFEYKYVIMDEKTGSVLKWEEGDNRISTSQEVQAGEVQVIWDHRLRIHETNWKAAGVVVPVFSLRTANSQGIGDFNDLRKMVDWAKQTGLKFIQLLPIYDTTQTYTFKDSYPYNSISIYALNPVYIDLTQLSRIADEEYMEKFHAECQRLNSEPVVNWVEVQKLKWNYLSALYEQEGDAVRASSSFLQFVSDNSWTLPYSVFCALRDREGTCQFANWSELSVYDQKEVETFARNNEHEVGFYTFVQYLLATQLASTSRYARSKGVVLKGDIPIGIARTSVEAWAEPDYFNMNGQAGAPPDDFCEEGQTWGFPTYNWDMMAKDGYNWWLQRLQKMSEYFDAYRIDHVLGFFRIWEVPLNAKSALDGHFAPQLPLTISEIENMGLPWTSTYNKENSLFLPYSVDGHVVGYSPRINAKKTDIYRSMSQQERYLVDQIYEDYYYHRHDTFWEEEAMKKLPALTQSTRMLVCAEDLGMVPACVGPVLDRLKVLSLEIQTMPKAMWTKFGNLQENPYYSVSTIFTHDMPTLRLWWQQNPQLRQDYFNEILQRDGVAPASMPGWIAEDVVSKHLSCPSMLTLISIQDWLSMDEELRYAGNDATVEELEAERINVPSDPDNNWNYRMHLNIESLLEQDAFNTKVRNMIERSGR